MIFLFFALTVPSVAEDNIPGNKENMVSGLLYKVQFRQSCRRNNVWLICCSSLVGCSDQ